MSNIKRANVFEDIKSYDDYFFNIIFTDSPYNLSSVWYVDPIDGRYKIKKKSDFMNKWDGLDENDLDLFFKESFRIMKYGGYLCLFGMDRQISPFSYYAVKNGFQVQQSLYWYYTCNDDKTEILTKNGWKKYNYIEKTDYVLTFNYNKNISEWKKINDVFIYNVVEEDLINIFNRDIDQNVTFNHRLLCKQKTNPRYKYDTWHFIKAEELLKKENTVYATFPLSFKNNEGNSENLIEYYELLGWVFTDGWYQKGDNSIRISQSSSNQSKVNRIRNLIKKLNIQYKEYNRNRIWEYKNNKKEYIEFIFYINNEISKDIRKKYPHKKPTMNLLNLSYKERYSLFLGLMGGDGSYCMKDNNLYIDIYEAINSTIENFNGTFIANNKEMIDFMQAVCQSLGFSTKLRYKNKKKYILNISHKQTTEIQNRNKIKVNKYSGDIWSISVENENYLIRRNGKCSFTGNSNFPKATDVSKIIDKRFNKERKVVGKKTGRAGKPMTDIRGGNITNGKPASIDCSNITEPSHDLAKKYDGYKYSVAPLKQVVETILVFRKPIKGNSILDDVIEAETDNEISPSIINIDDNRVGKKAGDRFEYGVKGIPRKTGLVYGEQNGVHNYTGKEGRYPAQLFIECICDEVIEEGEDETPFDYTNKKEYNVKGFIADIRPESPSNYNDAHKKIIHTNSDCPCAKLDMQSGDRKGWSSQNHNSFNMYGGNSLLSSKTEREGFYEGYNDTGGVSRILHQIRYEKDEMDLLFYNPKITGAERNEGLENLDKKDRVFNGKSDKSSKDVKDVEERFTTSPSANPHPTLKPISLISHIASLFKLPDECDQKVYVPFCGTFSEIIGFVKAGYKIDNIYGCEINEYYYEIGQKRLEYFIKKFSNKNVMEKFL